MVRPWFICCLRSKLESSRMAPKEKQKIEIEKSHRDPLLSFNQAVTVDCSDFLGTALIGHENFSFFCRIFLGHPEARASASKASGCFMGGNPASFGAEPGKQKTRSRRTQELARRSVQENARLKKGGLLAQ